jgi:hypothetical protein
MIHVRVPIYIKRKKGKYYPFCLNNDYTEKFIKCSFKSGLLDQFKKHLLTLPAEMLFKMQDVPAKKIPKLIRYFLFKRIYVFDFYFDVLHYN